MSSPISRDNRLEGHELYAPRSVREKWSEDQTALGLKPDARENDQLQASGSDPWYARPQAADARAVGDDDIREVIDVEPTAPADLDFQPAPAISSQDETGWPPASFDGRLRERVPVQAAARRSFLLDPDIVPDPPIARRGFPAIGLLARFSLMVGVAAAIACGVTMMSSSKPDDGWMKRAGGSTAAFGPTFHAAQSEPQAASRLVADDQQTFTNDPLPLGIAVDHEKGNESLVLDGLAVGTRLSAGAPIGASGWRLAPNELRGLYLYAPTDFVGVMNTAITLLAPDKRLLDSRAVRLIWVAKKPAPLPPSDRVASAVPIAPARPAVPAVQPMDPAEIAVLVSRGQDSLKAGDIEAARIGFGRLADAGIAAGALALASTYDPRYLAEHNVVGVRGDEAKARALYQRAMELGSAEAGRILASAATK